MNTSDLFVATSLLLSTLLASAVLGKEDEVLTARNAYTIRSKGVDEKRTRMLSITDGKLCFMTNASDGTKPSPSTPSVAKVPDYSFGFVRDSSFLRVFIYADDRAKSKELAATHGWYLSGDYATTPPRVVLTKKPTKYSRWKFIKVPKEFGSDGYYAHIKNENDLGKDAWFCTF
jgi:hypothetical protein